MSHLSTAFRLSAITVSATVLCLGVAGAAKAQNKTARGVAGSSTDAVSKFRQLDTELRSPNVYRSASGAPGPAYWQQRADVKIDARLDEDTQRIFAEMDIDYVNNSPDPLNYIWLALDQNRFKDGSMARESATASGAGTRRGQGAGGADRISFGQMRYNQAMEDREYGFEFEKIAHADDRELDYFVNDTMLRIDLDEPLEPGETFSFQVDWEHNIVDEERVGARGGFEVLEDGNMIFAISQWFPRLAAYTDYAGWRNSQFLGRGEFTLEFGDYEVELTVPSDHIVSATGVLANPRDVLTAQQRRRLENVSPDETSFIVTPEEAEENSETRATGSKTWRFEAENVRDFSWASSRRFIWDAMTFEQEGAEHPEVLAMSFYPPEGNPTWGQYSTQAVVHTMDVYNRFAFQYPYPTSQSVSFSPGGFGMEYPMITFNGYRPSEDEKSGEIVYSRNAKYGLIGVIIHEIGHIYFPMVVNSDERENTWMDEGLNTFLEYMAEYEWEENFPIRGGYQNPLDQITGYMQSTNQVPIMTQSDSVLQFGPNAYAKPAAALIVLRETVMGREAFDFAFREYANRWKFKRPTPEDFFRTMEDASAVDLDWFWRGWFFGTDYVDMAITSVREYQIGTGDPDIEKDIDREEDLAKYPENIVQRRNREEGMIPRRQRMDTLDDFYNENDKFAVTNADRNKFKSFMDGLEDWEREVYDRAMEDGQYIYFVDFENQGGLISPLPLKLYYANGKTEEVMVPAEIWRRNSERVTKLIVRDDRIESIVLDEAHQTADADYSDNAFPQQVAADRLSLYKSNRTRSNMMADMLRELKTEDAAEEGSDASMPMDRSESTTTRRRATSSDTATDAPAESAKTIETDGDAKGDDAKRDDAKDDDAKSSSLRDALRRMLGRDAD